MYVGTARFACSLFAYVVLGPCRPLIVRGDTYQEECIYTMCWPAVDSVLELSPPEPLYTFAHPLTPVYSFIFYPSGICRTDRGSSLALGHESRPILGYQPLVLEPANHITATNGLMFAGDALISDRCNDERDHAGRAISSGMFLPARLLTDNMAGVAQNCRHLIGM